MKKTYLLLFVLLLTGCSEKLVDMKNSLINRISPSSEVTSDKNIQNFSTPDKESYIPLRMANQLFQVEVADTPALHREGLMYREYLEPSTGMLFKFKNEGYPAFWMKNTYIPLDVIWISANKKVVDIQTLPPCQSEPCPVFNPRGKAQYVLELNAGAFQGNVGENVEF